MSKARTKPMELGDRWYRGDEVPLSAIHEFARQVAERFRPEKIILFGSYAYGTPTADSDVDLLVVMPVRNEVDQASRIRLAVPRRFPMDLIVRTPRNLRWRLEEGDWFLREIVSRGKVLYEAPDSGLGPESLHRPRAGGATTGQLRRAAHAHLCLHPPRAGGATTGPL